MQASYQQKKLIFKRPGGTSRGVLTEKETYFLKIANKGKMGIGECGIFRGLSFDDVPNYEDKLKWLCRNINLPAEEIKNELHFFPSIIAGYEQALLNLQLEDSLYFPSAFTKSEKSITINGLIWMGSVGFMKEQIQQKIAENFHCIKLKIGTNWAEEKRILKELRTHFPIEKLELRVDANGGFTFKQAPSVLEDLAKMQIHSIEQPIKAGQWQEMAALCETSPTPIALDEELIGVLDLEKKTELLKTIHPQFIILKPSLIGGFLGADEWIHLVREHKTGWWITSALESNIGLNALAQYTFTKQNPMPQGLGTGALFTNNTISSLELIGDQLWFKK